MPLNLLFLPRFTWFLKIKCSSDCCKVLVSKVPKKLCLMDLASFFFPLLLLKDRLLEFLVQPFSLIPLISLFLML